MLVAMTAHVDTFARDRLPPPSAMPAIDLSGAPSYPARLNCAAELLDGAIARGWGDRVAIRFEGSRITYRALTERVNRLAQVLVTDFGVVPGARVLLRSPNNPSMVAAWFAVIKAGAIAVATMPMLRSRELRYVIEKAQVGLALTDPRLRDELDEAGGGARVVTFDELDDRAARRSGEFRAIDTDAEDVALIAFTSGTTGPAKGAMHFHRDVVVVTDLFPPQCLRANESDIFCGTPPLAFTFGLGALVLFPFRVGASTLLVEKPGPEALLDAIQAERATVLFTAPTMFRALAELVPRYDLRSLAKSVSAGETLPAGTFEAWREATGIRIIDGLGSTELLHIFVASPPEEARAGATGRALRGYEVRVLDESGARANDGEIGRLAVRGATGCKYLDDIARQNAYVQDGWNLTGDAYVEDDEGYFHFQARTDDLIVSAGYNISGSEVEAVLLEHACVKECAVVASPDASRGFVVKAFVVLRAAEDAHDATARALQDHVKATIAPYKYPRAIEFVDALPRTESGKVQRFKLRTLDAERRGK
jgi:2-aminobenzoate-CoA ligase